MTRQVCLPSAAVYRPDPAPTDSAYRAVRDNSNSILAGDWAVGERRGGIERIRKQTRQKAERERRVPKDNAGMDLAGSSITGAKAPFHWPRCLPGWGVFPYFLLLLGMY